MDTRDKLRQQFLVECGLEKIPLTPLPQDASNRRYYRLRNAGRPLMLMDAPPPAENVQPFLSVAQHLQTVGQRPPNILQADAAHGFVLLEDLGHDTFTRLLDNGADASELYAMAIDALVRLHRHPDAAAINVPAYDGPTLIREAQLLTDWFYPAHHGHRLETDAGQGYRTAWREVFESLPQIQPTLVLRDFHVDNLMAITEGGTRLCALLDFQDALLGPAAYDVVSLLEDARRDLDPPLIDAMLARYRRAMAAHDTNFDPGDFERWYRCLGAQRHAKVLGIFVRLYVRDGKDVYLQHLQRVARLLQGHLEHADLAPVARWFEVWMPTGFTLTGRIDAKCIAAVSGPAW